MSKVGGCLRVLALLFVCLLGGAAGGVVVGWVIWPVSYVDTEVSDLKRGYQDDYILMTADAYQLDGDLDTAMQRLVRLHEEVLGRRIVGLAHREMAAGAPRADVRPLVELAGALDVASDAMRDYVATPTPTPTRVPPVPTGTPIMTATPTATPGTSLPGGSAGSPD